MSQTTALIACRHLPVLALLLFLQACVSVPFDYPKEASSTPPISESTSLGESGLRWIEEHGHRSGFVGLGSGMDALGARMRLIELAESTIDAQYFLIKPDRAGGLFVGKLLRAADRGVKVRLILDDIFTTAPDSAIALLNTHPNVEVRLFNPMSRQSFKYWNYLVDFKRANRRMHNKSFIVDNAYSIVGGRNIAEEYYDLNEKVKFDDYEVLTIGSVVEEISAGFDLFWNSELAVPMEAFDIDVDVTDLDDWRQAMEEEVESGATGIYQTAVNSPLIQDLMAGQVEPAIAEATLITDDPSKLQGAIGDAELATLANEIGRRFNAAESEILIITPYFVPLDQGSQVLERLVERGIRVMVVTNSLASTNHVAVHSGYAKYRKRLLRAGVEIYEIKADAVEVQEGSLVNPDTLTLHSKATIIDRSTVFIGSLNFDPRSLEINTEMGLFIESPEAGDGLYEQVASSLADVTYKLVLNDDGDLEWHFLGEPGVAPLTKEPLTTWGRRFSSGFYGILPLDRQL